MIANLQILRLDYCTRYLYASDNVFDKHFYISFAAHVSGVQYLRISFWEWLLGADNIAHIDQHLHAAFYKMRVHWYHLDGKMASIDEEVALHSIKRQIDALSSGKGGPKFIEHRRGRRGSWPKKAIDLNALT